MSLISMAFDLLMPGKTNNTRDHQGFGRKGFGEKIDLPDRSNHANRGKNGQFGNKREKGGFGSAADSHRRTTTLSQRQRELNRQQWDSVQLPETTTHRSVTVTRKVQESEDIVLLELSLDDGSELAYKAGQFLTCHFLVPQNSAAAKGSETTEHKLVRRAYSIACAPGSGNLCLAIKKLENGAASEFIHTQLKKGDQFEVSGPSGDFCLNDAVATRVFIAGGSGITPIKSQIDTLLEAGCDSPVVLIYANRRQRSIAFKKHFKALEKIHANLHVVHVLSEPAANWKGIKGRLNKSALDAILKEHVPKKQLLSAQFYLCGPEGLIDIAEQFLTEQDVPVGQIKKEHFLPAASASHQRSDVNQQVYFSLSGQKVEARPDESLLEAGLRAGVALQSSCQVGGCGHCKVKLRSGEVSSDEPNCLSEEEFKQGYRLACLSYANSTVEIEA